MMEESSFNRRVADVFGALDKCGPSKISTTRSDEDSRDNRSKNKEVPEQPSPSIKHHRDNPNGTGEQSIVSKDSAGSQSHPKMRKHPRDHSNDTDDTEEHSPGTRDDREGHRKHSHSSHDYSRSSKRPRYDHRRKQTSHVPEHRKHPQKWTKYDLSEDGTNSLRGLSSEQINKHAALEFLSELRKNQSEGLDSSEPHAATVQSKDSELISSDSPSKITFKKPRKKIETSKSTSSPKGEVVAPVTDPDDVTSASHEHRELSHDCIHDYHEGGGAGVVKMPEYEVGSKQTVPRKRKPIAMSEAKRMESDGRKVVNLSHLQDEEEEYI